MSYCRFSSENFRCDVYAYQHVYGYYEIIVAKARYTTPDNPLASDMVEIEGIYDGKIFRCGTLDEFEKTLSLLREKGYRVPEFVFERIKLEKKEAL